ncbi:glycosyltransferase family 2 protein [Jhaorihella thermophila]
MPIPQGRGRADWTAGASLMIRREVLDQVGTFDEAYFLYFEETDLCLRGARAGWSCYYVPESRVVHVGSVSTGLKSAERTPQYWFDSRLYYFIKNHGRLYATAATLAWIAGAGIWTVNRTLTRKPDRHRKGHMADLVSHALRQVIGRRGDGRGPARGALVEDRK